MEVWYYSKHGLGGETDRQFNTEVKWDIPLLEGYKSKFLKNYSWKPGIYNGFWGFFSLGVIKNLWNKPKSVIVVHGWNSITNIITIVIARLFGHKIALRGESPITLEMERSPLALSLRKVVFFPLFSLVNYFLYIGTRNLKFYQFYNIDSKRLIFTPYSVDNQRFTLSYKSLISKRDTLRQQKGLNKNIIYVLYSGKYMDKKHPMDLLKAVNHLQKKEVAVGAIFMGEGILRQQMEDYIKEQQINHVILTGFINQSEVPVYYSISDIFVMCSDADETWGLSTNEAMNFGLPILAYETVGCAIDLVKPGVNGFIVPKGDITALEQSIAAIVEDPESRYQMGEASLKTIENYSYQNIIAGLKTMYNGA